MVLKSRKILIARLLHPYTWGLPNHSYERASKAYGVEVKEGEQQLIKIKYDIRGPPFDAENKRERGIAMRGR